MGYVRRMGRHKAARVSLITADVTERPLPSFRVVPYSIRTKTLELTSTELQGSEVTPCVVCLSWAFKNPCAYRQ